MSYLMVDSDTLQLEITAARSELAEAQAKLLAVEAVRANLAETADLYCAIEDHVRAGLLLHCSADLRAALGR